MRDEEFGEGRALPLSRSNNVGEVAINSIRRAEKTVILAGLFSPPCVNVDIPARSTSGQPTLYGTITYTHGNVQYVHGLDYR